MKFNCSSYAKACACSARFSCKGSSLRFDERLNPPPLTARTAMRRGASRKSICFLVRHDPPHKKQRANPRREKNSDESNTQTRPFPIGASRRHSGCIEGFGEGGRHTTDVSRTPCL